VAEPGSPDLPDYPDWTTGRAEALGPGHGLKLGRGEIRSRKIADLEVGTLRVGRVTRSDASET
jgi:hypothetical protein